MKMGRTGPLLEPRRRLQAGKFGYPRSQNTDNVNSLFIFILILGVHRHQFFLFYTMFPNKAMALDIWGSSVAPGCNVWFHFVVVILQQMP